MTTAVKTVVAVGVTALGALFGIGFLISALFEAQGFGDRDSTPSGWRFVEYAAGLVACVVIPAFVWRKLVAASSRVWPIALAIAAAGVLVILGISLTG